MIKRREFLGLVVGTAACVATLALLLPSSRPDVRGWRFGVWGIIDHYGIRHGQNYYWCRCDCGAERVVGLGQLLSIDAPSCGHARHRGVFSINPDAVYCQSCGERRRWFLNGDGMRMWRCGNCEEADVRAFLRREYG